MANTCFGQKVQSFDVIVYGGNPAGVMAANIKMIGHGNKFKNQPGTFGNMHLLTNPLAELGSYVRFSSKNPLMGDYQLYFNIPALRGGITVINLEV
jgi:hypothetical protein